MPFLFRPIHRSRIEMRTLVVHTGGIGDFLLFCPSLKRLAEEGPVELAGRRDRLMLAVVSSITEDAHEIEAIGFESVFTQITPEFEKFAATFDRVVVWMRDEGRIESALRDCGVREVHVHPGLPPPGWNRHACDYYADCLGLGDLPPLSLTFERYDRELDVVIHPGSGSRSKNWPLERFAAVANALVTAGRDVSWLLGPAEEQWTPPMCGEVLRPASVLTLARMLTSARGYLGNDSGVTHLAAACGCPTVAVFGPTDPGVWAPRGEHVSVIAGEPWPEAPDVLDAALRRFPRP
jgi:hypothetical protein